MPDSVKKQAFDAMTPAERAEHDAAAVEAEVQTQELSTPW